MVDNIKEIGSGIKCMEKELFHGPLENAMKGITITTRSMERVNLFILMDHTMKDIGGMG